MQVKVLFDKQAINNNFQAGWGMSFLIGDSILFDTGENGQRLVHNFKEIGADTDLLQAIAISHDHWDHTGGLWEVLKRKSLLVYGCPDFSDEFKRRVKDSGSEFIGVDKLTAIGENIYLSGQIRGTYVGRGIAEQAVIIKSVKGISVLTGCSHPGIVRMLEQIKSEFPKEEFYLVAGGFHLLEQDQRLIRIMVEQFQALAVKKAGPTHCTGTEAEDIFKAKYKNNFIPIRVGQVLEL